MTPALPDEFLGWPFFEDGHRALTADLDAWCRRDLESLIEAEHAAGAEAAALDDVCRRMVRAMGAAGLLRNCVPGEYGGAVAGRVDARRLCLLRDGLARRSGLADFAFAMQGLGSGPVFLFGDEAQKRRILPEVAAGRRIAAFAISEENAGSNPADMAMTARADGGEYVLDGEKTWISNAGLADHYAVFARTGEAPGAKGLSAFIVEADRPGLTVARRIAVIAPHPLGTLAFDNCRIPAANRIGGPGDGFRIAMATLDLFRSTVGAAALGLARRALAAALARVAERKIGDKRLADYQITRAKLADMATAIDAAALLVYRAAWTKDTQNRRITREAAMAKLFATENAQLVIDHAVQLFGGLGVVSGNVAERLYREIRALRIYEGTSEIQKLVIAEAILSAENQRKGKPR